ncbi:MAG: GAF domain-containing protein, partial [Pseudomonadota bacterium]
MSQPDFDVTTSRAAPLHPDEANRLRALRKTGALDSPSVPLLDQITKSAARLLNVEISLITLVDAERQWFLSRHGLKANETHRDFAFCSHALHAREIYTVEDASTHPTFRDNPLVTGDPFIRSYAGAVLRDLSGLPLGTLCVIGKEPRVFSDGELDILKELAKIVRRDILTIAARDQSEDSRRYDPVTGAFWGDSFYNAAKRLSSELGLQHGASIICSTTIENLSVIADTSGSSVTDRVIEDVGAKMQSVLESFGLTLLGRPDGKRIISKTVIDTEADPEKLDEVRAALMSAFSDGPALNEGGLTPRLVVAVAQRRTDLRLEDVVMMCRIASEETEKRDGVSSVVVTQSIERDVLARIRLTEDIGTALDKDQLHLEFQPKLNTRTQSVTGCECLIRWEHPTVGRVPA